MGIRVAVLNYRDLEVWRNSRKLVKDVYELTERFPQKEIYSLTSQLRRAAVSIPSNIAEGHSRSSTKDYIQFVSIAIGSLAELDTQLLLAEDLGYIQAGGCNALHKPDCSITKNASFLAPITQE